MPELLEGLNERQRLAVSAGMGPVLILAGPGSGKTRVLTHRIAYLIQEKRVPANAIMAVTFTNKAAREMRSRVDGLIYEKSKGLYIGTFHAICARLLRIEGEHTPYGREYLIYDSDDQLSVVKQTLAELNIDPKRLTPGRALSMISSAKNELINPANFESSDYITEVVQRVYGRYQAILLDNNAMDFDDLLMQMVLLLRENNNLLEKYQRRFDFVLVDEFQDTNTAQYTLVGLLGQPSNNIFVVGDEDQGIYAFRGADYRNVLTFRRDYPGAQVVLLEQNYRSTQTVLDAARAVIDKNPNRTPKALFTDKGTGTKITVYEAYTEEYEADYVVGQIEKLIQQEDMTWQDFAVMYRTNAQSRAIESAFIREGIPYKLVGGVGFYKRIEIRDLMAYLRYVNNPNDSVSFNRIINKPRRGIGEKSQAAFVQWAKSACDDHNDAYARLMQGQDSPLSSRVARLFADFGKQFMAWKQIALQNELIELLDKIIEDIGFIKYLDEISDNDAQAVERNENVQEFRNLLAAAQKEGLSLGEFLAEQSLLTDADTGPEQPNSVTLLTLHAAKGLEFPIVFITGLEEGLLPHSRSFEDPEGMAEERRLMYVGITRAEERLFLTYAFRRSSWGGSSEPKEPSRFLADLPAGLIDGLSVKAQNTASQRSYQQQTTWDTPLFSDRSSAARSSTASQKSSTGRFNDKIVPFPGVGSKAPATAFKSNDRVRHGTFGTGIVVESKMQGEIEYVTVVFEDRKFGIKTLTAEYLSPVE